jgi:hypothetical protein
VPKTFLRLPLLADALQKRSRLKMGQASRSAFGESSRANRIGPGGHTPSFAGDLSLQGESDRNLSAQGWPGCPLWVKSGLSSQHQSMTALPPKADISAMGWAGRFMSTRSRPCTHKSRLVSSGWSLSALPPKADIRQRIEHVFCARWHGSVSFHQFSPP